MNHMASVQKGPASKGSGDKLDPVVQRVVDSNPLLEAFGNAKTRRNDNSSRFGKYLQLQFDNSEASLMAYGEKTESKCKLAGSKCDVYLLEKNRVTGHDPEERTYHIFYQLLAAENSSKSNFWSKLSGCDNSSFKYVGRTNTTSIEGKTDAQHFQQTVQTLESINIKGEKLRSMFRAICAVMQCGNLTFGGSEKAEITSKSECADLADLMGVSVSDLTNAFTERTMKTRTETYKVPLNAEFAKDACDALAREVYGNIFLWLVKEINAATCAEDNYKDRSLQSFGTIGLLDIFGFESFAVNRFEQLCINYANEKLQQKFTEDIFRSVQEEYEEEGIALAEIWYDDNTDVLDLIEGRTGLLALLNEECVRPKGNDQDFVQKALMQNKDSPCMIVNKMDRMSFGIHHYAGKVMYDAEKFVTSNQDTLPTDLSDLCLKSNNKLIAEKMEIEGATAEGARGAAPKRQKSNLVAPTVWGKYKTQLASLMSELRKTQSRYIRCIKPNMAKKPVLMEHGATVEQLRCAGVVAAVTLSRSAFPNRLENQVARYRYASMWDPKAFPAKINDSMVPAEIIAAECDAILACALKSKELIENGRTVKAYVVGKTKSYFRAGALEFLEANRMENGLDAPAMQIQKMARGFLVRKNWDKLANAQKEADRKKAEEEARRAREAKAREEALFKKKAQDKARQLREAKEQKEREERERKLREEELARKKREQDEREAIAREEEEMEAQEKKLQKKIRKLQKELETKKKECEAEAEADQIEAEKNELKKKHDQMMKLAADTPKEEIEKNKKKIEESEKIVAYLRKENNKVRDQTESMKEELQQLKDQNSRLVEANASAGASLDSLEKQKKSLADHNVKLEDNLKKWKAQNKQLKADLANRTAYYKAETKIRSEYEKAMEQIVSLLESKCDDHKLLEEVTAAQLQCEAIASHKSSSNPALAGSDVSDF
jgi:myosin V